MSEYMTEQRVLEYGEALAKSETKFIHNPTSPEEIYHNNHRIPYGQGISEGFQQAVTLLWPLVDALTIYAALKSNNLIEPGHPGNIAGEALRELEEKIGGKGE